MERIHQRPTQTSAPASSTVGESPPSAEREPASSSVRPEIQEAQKSLERARERFHSAALAFCDGLISEGQLRAVREMLQEKELHLAEIEGEHAAPFREEEPVVHLHLESLPERKLPSSEAAAPSRDTTQGLQELELDQELETKLARLTEKIARLEADFHQSRINATQYRAIRRHYLEQHEVALRLHKANPTSDRWRVVLEEGKTRFLMQLNEAECRCVAFYDMSSRDCIYVEGELPPESEDAMRFLATFGPNSEEPRAGRMFATQTDEGVNLLLIPGRHTAALVAFSDEPPGWQVRALREVLRNFEAANQVALSRGERKSLVFPNLDRFFRN